MLHIEDAVHEDRDRVALEHQPESIATTIIRIGWAASAPRRRKRSGRRTTEDRRGARLEMLAQIRRDLLVVVDAALREPIGRKAAAHGRVASEEPRRVPAIRLVG